MPDIVQNGQPASWSTVYGAFSAVQSTGQAILDSIANARTNLLSELQINLEQLNGKQQVARRIPNPAVAARFLVSDFVDLDQAQSTATIRANTQSVTLRERATPTNATILSTTFSADQGTVGQSNGIYQVTTPDGSAPLGVFKLTLTAAYNLSLITFDILSMPSSPQIVVRTSPDDVVYTQSPQVAQSGYQVTAWLPSTSVKFIRLEITPSHPDTLSGSTYSFGITDFAALAVTFNLASELVTRPVQVTPRGATMRFVADTDPGLGYFLSWDGQAFFPVNSGGLVPVPGSTSINLSAVSLNIYGQLSELLPANVYLPTLAITDKASGAPYRIAPGLLVPPFDGSNSYMAVPEPPAGGPIILMPYEEPTSPPTFQMQYQTGPSALIAYLRVQLATTDPSLTPVFHGATLQNV